jgi:hypothetical protein
LVIRKNSPESHRLGDRRIEVTHLEIKVHHRTLLASQWGPHGRRVTSRLLKYDVHGPLRRRENRCSRLLVANGPIE